jgi:hypothetical protein
LPCAPQRSSGAIRGNLAGELHAGYLGHARRRGIFAFALQKVRAGESGGVDLDQDFIPAGLGLGNVLDFQDFGTAGAGDDGCVHGNT